MGLNGATFCKELDTMIPGWGFKRHLPGVNLHSLRDSNGNVLDQSSTPPWAALETNAIGVQVASSQTAIGGFVFTVPRDYDQSVDYLRFRVLAQSGGTTDTPSIDAAIYRKRAGSALSADLDPTISGVIVISSSAGSWVEIDADGLSIRPGDVLTVVLSLGGTRGTTDSADLYDLEVYYKSDLVFYEKTERS